MPPDFAGFGESLRFVCGMVGREALPRPLLMHQLLRASPCIFAACVGHERTVWGGRAAQKYGNLGAEHRQSSLSEGARSVRVSVQACEGRLWRTRWRPEQAADRPGITTPLRSLQT